MSQETKIVWDAKQLQVLEQVEQGKNVFCTGSAGVGKSKLIGQLIETYGRNTTSIVASTGLAAVAVGGTTMHSFFMVGKGEDSVEELCKRAQWKIKTANGRRLQATKLLIVDEISMISGEVLDKMEAVARVVRCESSLSHNDPSKPFGGLQVIFFGDFLQLPPVKARLMAYQAESWKRLNLSIILLTKIFRQSDQEFVGMLQELRFGQCSSATERRLKQCEKNILVPIDGIEATKLHARRRDVERENLEQLAKLPSEKVYDFKAQDSGPRTDLLAECQSPANLSLKVGAQVLLVKNLDVKGGLCNGTRAVVLDFHPVTDSTTELASTKERMLPRVRFENGMELILHAEETVIRSGHDILARRVQIPLTLAWSLTIHKSQGMTLSRAEVDVSGVFDNGQTYVAISRVKSLEGLRLKGFEPRNVKAHPGIVDFYRGLEGSSKQDTTPDTRSRETTTERKTPDSKPTMDAETASLVNEIDMAIAAHRKSVKRSMTDREENESKRTRYS